MPFAQYTPTHITTATTTVIASSGNVTMHTISFPKATTGTVTVQNGAGSSLMVYPVGSIGSMLLDAIYPNGLQIVTSAADAVVVTTQTP